MADDPRVEPLAKRMFCTQHPGAMFKWGELSEPIKDDYRRAARLALSLIDARVKVAREALLELACLGNGREFGNSVGNSIAQRALRDLDALARELEPEPNEPTVEEAAWTLVNDTMFHKVESALFVKLKHVKALEAALERAKGGQS